MVGEAGRVLSLTRASNMVREVVVLVCVGVRCLGWEDGDGVMSLGEVVSVYEIRSRSMERASCKNERWLEEWQARQVPMG